MDDAACIREFERLSERLGIEVRRVSGVSSGLCVVKGQRVLFLDSALGPEEALVVFAREFRGIDTGGMFVVPAIRRFLENDDE